MPLVSFKFLGVQEDDITAVSGEVTVRGKAQRGPAPTALFSNGHSLPYGCRIPTFKVK